MVPKETGKLNLGKGKLSEAWEDNKAEGARAN